MFERFTTEARRTVVRSRDLARELRHDRIGTEHLLLALLEDAESPASRALARLSVTRDKARAEVERLVGRGEKVPTGHIPFTPRAKKVLELALREALRLKVNYIGTEHILLGLVREGEGAAAKVLHVLGASPDDVRRHVEAVVAEDKRSGGDQPLAPTPRRTHTPAAAEALAIAEQLAGGSPIGSHHLLEALARSQGSAAAQALAAVGVDVEVLAATLDEHGLAGTTDLTPEEEATRQMEVRLDGDEVHVVLRDEATRRKVAAAVDRVGGPLRGDDPLAAGLATVYQAVDRYLDRLEERLAPPEETTGGTATLRQAVMSRLRRRGR
ncbi:MAG: Clp protease N-terminal domain-containing protein [Micromonosporaceae bacterium]|jgi:ATP-dependent Clp protease ATP-binding subunit ClpA